MLTILLSLKKILIKRKVNITFVKFFKPVGWIEKSENFSVLLSQLTLEKKGGTIFTFSLSSFKDCFISTYSFVFFFFFQFFFSFSIETENYHNNDAQGKN